jgi:hypothetical protein
LGKFDLQIEVTSWTVSKQPSAHESNNHTHTLPHDMNSQVWYVPLSGWNGVCNSHMVDNWVLEIINFFAMTDFFSTNCQQMGLHYFSMEESFIRLQL